MKKSEHPILEMNLPIIYREDIVKQIFECVQKNESFSFVGMEDNCKINVLRFLSLRTDIQKKYLKNKYNKYLFVIVDLNELMEVSPTGFYHLIGLSLIETLKKEKINFSFLNNIFIDSPVILLKSLKEDLEKTVEKTGKSIVILFNEFDIVTKKFDIELFSRNLVALRNAARFKIIYGFTGLRPFAPKHSFFRKIIWMTPYSGEDALGVVGRNEKRYKVHLSNNQREKVANLSGGHAGTIKFIVQNLNQKKGKEIDKTLETIDNCSDLCLQCERILSPLTDIEKSKLKNCSYETLLINEGFLKEEKGKLEIFSPILKKYLEGEKCVLKPFCFDEENNEIYLFGEQLSKNLTLMEFNLLRFLIKADGKTLSRGQIMEKVWTGDDIPSDWAFDKLISRLNKKLSKVSDKDLLHVHKGKGITLSSA